MGYGCMCGKEREGVGSCMKSGLDWASVAIPSIFAANQTGVHEVCYLRAGGAAFFYSIVGFEI